MRELERHPPNGGLWFDCIRELVQRLRPIAVVQGHAHGWTGTSQTVEIDGQQVLIFHPGWLGGSLQIDVEKESAEIQWPAIPSHWARRRSDDFEL